MRHFVSCFLSLFVFFICALTAFASVELPNYSIVDGNTHIEKFMVKASGSDSLLQHWKSFITGSRSFSAIDVNGNFYFFIISPNSSISIEDDGTPADRFNVRFSGGASIVLLATMNVDDNSSYEFIGSSNGIQNYTGGTTVENLHGLLGGSYFSSTGYAPPSLSYDYSVSKTGNFVFIDDLNSSVSNWWDGILDWLGSFWQILVDTLKSLFIPSDDYFQNFFNEIKGAFDKKLGGLNNVFNSISSSFSSLKNFNADSSLVIKLPDNQFFYGYNGTSVDVLKSFASLISFVRNVFNAFLVVVTSVICYRKLISAIRG